MKLRAIHTISVALMIAIFASSTALVMAAHYSLAASAIFSFMNIIGATFPPDPALLDASNPYILLSVVIGIFANMAFTITVTTIFYQILSGMDIRYTMAKQKLRGVKRHAIITPINDMGMELAKKLQENKVPVVFIGENKQKVGKALELGAIALYGDAAKPETLAEARVDDAIALYVLHDDDVKNTFITIEAKRIRQSIRVITRIKRLDDLMKMERTGASRVMLPEAAVGIEMGDFLVSSI